VLLGVGVRGDPAPRRTLLPGALSLGRLLVGAVCLGSPAAPARRRADAREWLGSSSIGVLWFGVYNVALNAGERRSTPARPRC
jgi:hypothetical protein